MSLDFFREIMVVFMKETKEDISKLSDKIDSLSSDLAENKKAISNLDATFKDHIAEEESIIKKSTRIIIAVITVVLTCGFLTLWAMAPATLIFINNKIQEISK